LVDQIDDRKAAKQLLAARDERDLHRRARGIEHKE